MPLWLIYQEPCKAPLSWVNLRESSDFAAGAGCNESWSATWVLGPNRSNGIQNMSVAGREVVWNLWQSPNKKSPWRSLWLMRKAMPSFVDNYSSFEKSLLVYYWALIETEHLTIGHKGIIQTKLVFMNWVLPDPPNHKISHTKQHFIEDRNEGLPHP